MSINKSNGTPTRRALGKQRAQIVATVIVFPEQNLPRPPRREREIAHVYTRSRTYYTHQRSRMICNVGRDPPRLCYNRGGSSEQSSKRSRVYVSHRSIYKLSNRIIEAGRLFAAAFCSTIEQVPSFPPPPDMPISGYCICT